MRLLRISLFGSASIQWDDQPVELKATHTIRGLLAFLLLERHRSHSRDVLAGLFWGDYSDARAHSCLSTALWRLRRILEPEGIPHGTFLVTTPAGEVGFNANSNYWLDVAVFEEQVGRLLAQPAESIESQAMVQFESTLGLYRADLLEGFYDDWALRERERLRNLYLSGLEHLMCGYRSRGAYEESIACGQQVLRLDPLRENIHRELMRLFVESGQRAAAVRQYEICRQVLASELHIEPMAETQALYAWIAGQAGAGASWPDLTGQHTSLQLLAQQLDDTLRSLDQTRAQIRSGLEFIEKLMAHVDMEHNGFH